MRKRVILKAPLLTRSGYGEQARFALRSLRSREDLFEIFIQPLQWGQTSWVNEYNEEKKWIDETIEKTISYLQQGGTFDMSLQVTIPNEFERLAQFNVGFTAGIETTKVSPQWIQKVNQMDKVIVVSNHAKRGFDDTKYQAQNSQTGEIVTLETQTPVEAVNYPVKSFESLQELNLQLETPLNFLTVAQFGPRKNLENTIKWFVEEFRTEDVGLVVKSNIAKNCYIDRRRLLTTLKSLLAELGDRTCKVYLLHGDMSDEEMHSMYKNKNIHCLLSLAHGEGFGLPIFEAAYSGLPVIAVGWSGQLDFLIDSNGKEQFYNVSFDLNPVPEAVHWEGVIVPGSMWAYPRERSAKEQMRLCYKHITSDCVPWNNSEISDRFSQEKQYEKFVNAFYEQSKTTEEWLGEIESIIQEFE